MGQRPRPEDQRPVATRRSPACATGRSWPAWSAPALDPDLVAQLAARRITVLAMDAVPRISRAQSLDVLSSMANIAGYRAVIEAAHEFGRLFTGQVTAAGKVPPAKVLVVGAGRRRTRRDRDRRQPRRRRAGLRRPPGGRRAGRVDGRRVPAGRAVEDEAGQSADGLRPGRRREDFDRKAAELYAEQAEDVDIIITTALIPGRPAPRLITAEMVASMKPGSVIVDMAAANGGNVAGSGRRPGGRHRRTASRIIGYTDLPGRLPTQASQLFGTNLVNLLKLLTPGKDGQLVLDLDDVVAAGYDGVRDGEMLWPPPPVQVSAAPAAPVQPRRDAGGTPEKPHRTHGPAQRAARRGRPAASASWRSPPPALPRPLHGVRAGRRRRLLRHRQRRTTRCIRR